jgi:CheY-like chemotaxis protein
VRLAIEGAQRCADLTQRLLAFSRRQPLQAKVVDLNALMPGMLELMRRTLGERIQMELDAGPEAWPVEVDEAQLEAALLNLAVNARDAMPDGGRLTISVENRTLPEGAPRGEPGDYAVISVADTGTGMSPQVLERVFEPFFTTKETGKGTGLGLSMVYGFVQQSDGHIEVDSEEGRGTTIRLFLPRARGEAPAAQTERVAEPPREAFGAGRTVLVVEDDTAVRQVAVSTLHALGFAVREAESGDEAERILRREDGVSLVLSDVRMPGLVSGLDLARLVRDEWPGIRVLLTSGYVDADDQVGDFNFIHKPYRAADLAERIRALADGPPPPERYGEERRAARG